MVNLNVVVSGKAAHAAEIAAGSAVREAGPTWVAPYLRWTACKSGLRVEGIGPYLCVRVDVPGAGGLAGIGEGSFCLRVGAFEGLEGDVEVSLVDDKKAGHLVRMGYGKRAWRNLVQAGKPADFPSWPKPGNVPAVKVDAAALASVLARTRQAVAQPGPVSDSLLSVCIQGGRAVATDGKRLHVVPAPGIPDCRVTPAAARLIGTMARGDVYLVASHPEVLDAEGDGWAIRSVAPSAGFPYVDAVIPKPDDAKAVVAVGRQALLDALNRASLATKDPVVRLTAQSDRLLVEVDQHTATYRGNDDASFRERVVAGVTGARAWGAYDRRYLKQALAMHEEEEVTLRLASEFAPLVVDGDGGLAVIMPLRIGESPAQVPDEDGDAD